MVIVVFGKLFCHIHFYIVYSLIEFLDSSVEFIRHPFKVAVFQFYVFQKFGLGFVVG